MFQSTRPRGARRNRARDITRFQQFQSTRPRGARRRSTTRSASTSSFNPRARAGRDQRQRLGLTGFSSFNPRARAGRDLSATGASDIFTQFQSTRPRGARHPGKRMPIIIYSFNPRARAGRDLLRRTEDVRDVVSIHAPARGATELQAAIGGSPLFQSTRPRGARLNFLYLSSPGQSFNPRARAGRDILPLPTSSPGGVSIHAPARGATPDDCSRRGTSEVSIHAPARGATSCSGG